MTEQGITPASDFETLQETLALWDGRRRRQELLRLLPLGLLGGLLVALAAAVLSRARPLLTHDELVVLALAAALIAFSITGFVVLFRRRSLAEQARFGDRQFGLRERMTAAVEIQSEQLAADAGMAALQLRDALDAATAVDAQRRLPLEARPTEWLPALAALAVIVLLLWLPNPQEAALLERRALAGTIEEQAAALEALAEEIVANEALTPEQAEQLLRPLEDALQTLEQGDLSREEAVAALSAAEAELRELGATLEPANLDEALADAAAALGDEGAAAELSQALQSGQMAQASAAAAALGNSLAGLSAAEQAALAERLAAAAEGLQAADAELAATLERAAEALAEGDLEAASEALAETAGALSEREGAAAAAAQAGQTADQLGAAREEVAQGDSGAAGESGGESGGNGQGESAGQGEGAGDGAGQGGSGEGGQTGGGQQAGPGGGPGPGGGHVENVFVPDAGELSGAGQDLELEVQCLADPESCGPLGGQAPSSPGQQAGGGLVPYDQVFGDYRDAAFEALSGGNIPAGLQDVIRDYFSALEP